MASFATHRLKVLDPELPVERRHAALRTCLTIFAPYGFRDTYFHLTLSCRIPRQLEADPDSLIRAVDELHEARVLWLAAAERYAALRREQKAAGLRSPPKDTELRRDPFSWHVPYLAARPLRPAKLSLPVFVARRIAIAEGRTQGGCPWCGEQEQDGGAISYATGHGFIDLCRVCGAVLRPCGCGRSHRIDRCDNLPSWKAIWRRTHVPDW